MVSIEGQDWYQHTAVISKSPYAEPLTSQMMTGWTGSVGISPPLGTKSWALTNLHDDGTQASGFFFPLKLSAPVTETVQVAIDDFTNKRLITLGEK